MDSNEGWAKSARVGQLDALRAFAVMMVVISHWIQSKFLFGIFIGHEGVLLFFVISGYLITGIILRYLKSDKIVFLKAFYMRRVLRIFPPYFCLVGGVYFFTNSMDEIDLIFHAFFMSNILFFLSGSWVPHVSHLWSLSIEEQFYILWPAILLLVPKRLISYLPFVALLSAIVLNFVISANLDDSYFVHILPFVAFHGVAVGAYLKYSETSSLSHEISLRLAWIIGLPVFLLFYLVETPQYFWIIKDIGALFVFYSLVGKAASGFSGIMKFILEVPILVFTGRLSYGIYLYHMPAPDIMRYMLPTLGLPLEWRFGFSGLLIQAIITMGICVASWYLLEQPINNLKKKFPYARSQTHKLSSRCGLRRV